MNHILSTCNQHKAVISSMSWSATAPITINNFCSLGDIVTQICNFESTNSVTFRNSLFLFDKSVVLGSATYVIFAENCFSNISISSIPLNADATQLQFVAEECWNFNSSNCLKSGNNFEPTVKLIFFKLGFSQLCCV